MINKPVLYIRMDQTNRFVMLFPVSITDAIPDMQNNQ